MAKNNFCDVHLNCKLFDSLKYLSAPSVETLRALDDVDKLITNQEIKKEKLVNQDYNREHRQSRGRISSLNTFEG